MICCSPGASTYRFTTTCPNPFTSMWPGWGDGSIQAPRSALLLQPLDGRQPLKRHHQDSTSSSMAIAKAAACGTSCTLRSSR